MAKDDIKYLITTTLFANILVFFCSLQSVAFPVSLSPEAWANNFEVKFALPVEKLPFLLILGFVAAILKLKFCNNILPKIWKGNLMRNICKVIYFTIGFSLLATVYLYILGAEFHMYILLNGVECGMLVSMIHMMVRDTYFPPKAEEN